MKTSPDKLAAAKRYRERHKDVVLARTRAWRAANPESVKHYNCNRRFQYTEEQKEQIRHKDRIRSAKRRRENLTYIERMRNWHAKNYTKNKDSIYLRSKEWRKKNPDKVKIAKARRRAGVGFDVSDLERIRRAQRGRCGYCQSRLTEEHIDHIIPIARGGTNDRKNIQLLCPPCNQRKAARDPIVFARLIGYLL